MRGVGGYLPRARRRQVERLSWTGKGDIISMGATSIVLERILDEGLSMEEILEMDYGVRRLLVERL